MNNSLVKPLPLIIQNGIELTTSWDGISTPYDILKYVAKNAFTDPSAILSLSEVITSSLEPTGNDRTKIWIKSDGAPAFGIPIGGAYYMFYPYPPNTPILWIQGVENLPGYMQRVTSSELTSYGITQPVDNTFFYVKLIP